MNLHPQQLTLTPERAASIRKRMEMQLREPYDSSNPEVVINRKVQEFLLQPGKLEEHVGIFTPQFETWAHDSIKKSDDLALKYSADGNFSNADALKAGMTLSTYMKATRPDPLVNEEKATVFTNELMAFLENDAEGKKALEELERSKRKSPLPIAGMQESATQSVNIFADIIKFLSIVFGFDKQDEPTQGQDIGQANFNTLKPATTPVSSVQNTPQITRPR